MSNWPFAVEKRIGAVNGFILALFLTAAVKFAQVFYEIYQAVGDSGTHAAPGGIQIYVCYLRPPFSFYSRFFVFIFLCCAFCGAFTEKLWGGILQLAGIVGALSAYIYWWMASYFIFETFAGNFMTTSDLPQVAYLYEGTWLDVCLAVSLFVVLALKIETLLTKKFR